MESSMTIDRDGINDPSAKARRLAFVKERAWKVPKIVSGERITAEVRLDPAFEARRGILAASTLPPKYGLEGENQLIDMIEVLQGFWKKGSQSSWSIVGEVGLVVGARHSSRGDERYILPKGCELCRQAKDTFVILSAEWTFTLVREKSRVWRMVHVAKLIPSGRGSAGRSRARSGPAMDKGANSS